jgi:hypothetical protein
MQHGRIGNQLDRPHNTRWRELLQDRKKQTYLRRSAWKIIE